MKVRNGFVSNSSSSSFVCEVCGANEGGYDYSLSDVYMCRCENEHIFCIDHAINKDESSDDFNSFEDALEKEIDYIPSIYCPICQFETLPDKQILNYLFKTKGISREDVINEVISKFSNYEEFVSFLRQ